MKKFYLLTLGLLASLATQAQVTLVVGDERTEYDNIVTAFNAAIPNSSSKLEIASSMDVSARLMDDKKTVIYLEGVGDDITLNYTGPSNNHFFISKQGGSSAMHFKNLTLTSKTIRANYFEVNSATLTFDNVTLKDMQCKGGTSVFALLNSYTLKFKDTKIIGCSTNAAEGYYDVNTSRKIYLSGDNSLTIFLNGAQIEVEEALTNATPIDINFDTPANPVVIGCTDPTKFNLLNKEYALEAKDGNLVAVAKTAVQVVTDVEGDGLSGQYFNDLNEAMAAVNAYLADATIETKSQNITYLLNINQIITNRFGFPNNYNMTLKGNKAGVKIIDTYNSRTAGMFLNSETKRTHTIENLILDGNKIYRERQCVETTKGGSALRLKNVEIVNYTCNTHMLLASNTGKLYIDNVVLGENTACNVGALIGGTGSTVSGNTNLSFNIEKNYTVDAAGWTPSDATVYFTNTIDTNNASLTRKSGGKVFTNFTDVSKLKYKYADGTAADWALYVDGNNICARQDKVAKAVGTYLSNDNAVSLSVADADKYGVVTYYYAFTETEAAPAAADFTETAENGIISLDDFTGGESYLWVVAKAAGWVDSDVAMVGVYDLSGDVEHAHVGLTYNRISSNDALVVGNYYIIVANADGKHYAHGKDGSGVEVTDHDGSIYATASKFADVAEFCLTENGFVLEGGAAAAVMSRAAMNSASFDTDGNATVTVNGVEIGYHADNNAFVNAADATHGVMLYSTGSDANTGVDEVAVDAADAAEAVYYNLQGVRVDNPAPGRLYIKRQGARATKVIM